MAWPLIEQPANWLEPGIYPVVNGVYRIPLSVPLPGLWAVNAYILEASNGLIVIDPGWASPANEQAIAAALRQIGYRLRDITLALATHAHWDHYSQAYAWRETRGAPMRAGRGERVSIAAFDPQQIPFPYQAEMLRRSGAPELAARIAAKPLEDHEVGIPFGPPDVWLKSGDTIALREGELEVFETPGHTRGHVVFRYAQAGLLFSGDHVLPHITPSLGLEQVPEASPLRSFLDSLRLVHDLPDALLLPSHGPVANSVHARVDELVAHHEQRLTAVCDRLRAGDETAYAIAGSLPWTRRERRFADLELLHRMMAVMEIDAHLDVLLELGQVTLHDDNGVRRFALAS